MKSVTKEVHVFQIAGAEGVLQDLNENGGRDLGWKGHTAVSRQIQELMGEFDSIRDARQNLLDSYTVKEEDEDGNEVVVRNEQGHPKLKDPDAFHKERREQKESTREIEVWPLSAKDIHGELSQGEQTALSFMIFTPSEIAEIEGGTLEEGSEDDE